MATTGISPQKKANLRGPMTLLSAAICEWFLIFLLFVDATFSYILRRFAEYCDLPTPCIFCTRIDAPSGKRKFEYYNALLCRGHREVISSLVSCHAHGELTDVHEMCEECVMPMNDKLKSGSYIVGKLGTNIEKHSIQSLILHKKILPNSSGPRICPCCNRSWGAKLNAQTLFKLTPVGLGASKANVKPPLPRVRACSRFSRKNSFKKLSGMLEAPAIPQAEGKSLSDALSHVDYSELKVTSDSESEVNFSDEEERVIAVRGRKDRNLEHEKHYVAGTLLKSRTDEAVLEKHSNQNFADVTSLLDLHMQLETHKPLPTHGLEELNWEKPLPSTNISVSPDLNLLEDVSKAPSNESGDSSTTVKPQPHMPSIVMPDELIPLMNSPPCSDDKNQETLESHDEDDMTLAQQPIKSTVFTDGGVPYILNEISSTNSSAMTDEGKEVSTTSVEQPFASGSTKFEDIKSVTQLSDPGQDDSRISESGFDLNHVQALASLETKDSSLKLAERVSIPSGSTVFENVKSVIQQSAPEQNDSRNIGESSSDLNHVKALASLETNDSSLKLAERVSIPSGSTVFENVKSVIQQSAPEQDNSRNIGEPSSDMNHVKALASLETNDSSLKLAERVSIPSGSTVLENVKSVIQQSAPEQDDSRNVGEPSSDLNHVKALASLETNESSLILAERMSIPSASTVFENVESVIQQSAPEQEDSRNIGEPSSDLNHVKALASLETNESSVILAERMSIPSSSTVFENVKSVIQQSAPEQDDSRNVGEPSSDLNHVKALASLETNESSLILAERMSIPSASTVFENVKSVVQQSAPEQDDSRNVGEPSSDFNHVKPSRERNDSSLELAERGSISSGSTKFEDTKSVIQQSAPEQDDSRNIGESSSDFNHVKVLAVQERNVSSLKLAERVCLSSGSTKLEDNKSVIQQSAPEQDEIQNIDDPSSDENHVQALPSLERNDSSLKFAERVNLIDLEGECSIDMLKSQIEYDRKCMNDLYKELEEERNASSIAANQAMAMITRLQEEKAQLHMEALQYLRMMDEQAEYDMEALQKANDDLTEKEKELQDLEYELELYRNNINGHGGSPAHHPHKESSITMAENTAEVRHNESSMCDPSSPVSSKMSMADELSGNAMNSMPNLDKEKLYLVEYLKQLERRIHYVSCTEPSTGFDNSEHLEQNINKIDYQENSLTHDHIESVKKTDGLHMQNGFSEVDGTSKDSPTHLLEDHNTCCEETNHNRSNSQNLSTSGREPNMATLENETKNLKERLKAFEGDLEFIKHSLRALHNGNDGLEYIQQISDQLQELRNIEFKKRCLSIP